MKGISFEQVRHGLNKLALSGAEWPPGAPEFRSMCLPNAEDIGLPTEFEAEKAIKAIVTLARDRPIPKQHPAVYHAYTMIGVFNARQMSTEALEKAVKRAWKQVEEMALNGFEFPEQPLQIESKTGTIHKPANKNKGNDALKKLIEGLL